MIGFTPPSDSCSRAGCRVTATFQVVWSNPRIHKDGRTKTWLACDEHVTYLEEFLRARNFPVSVSPHPTQPDTPTPHTAEGIA